MQRMHVGTLVLVTLVAVLPACGHESNSYGSGKVTIAQITAVNPPNAINRVGICPEEVTISGGDYSDIVGLKVEVRWFTKDENDPTVPGPKILHDAERDFAATSGIVTTPTTIVAQSPAITVPCGLMLPDNVDGCIQVFLSSRALSDPLFIEDLFQLPDFSMAALNIATAPACEPVPFTLTAANLEPIGGAVTVHWVDTSAGNSFEGLNETTTLATITSATTIEGLTPNVVLCGLNGASDIVVNLDRVEWVNKPICIEIMPPLMLTFEAPDLTALTVDFINPPPATYAAAYLTGEVPSTFLENPNVAQLNKYDTTEGFIITGTGFGPIGGNALVTFTDLGGGAVFDDSGAAAVTVPGLVLNATTITGRLPGINDPLNRLAADVPTQVQVDFSTGCCVFQPTFATFMAPPTINTIVNLTAGTPGVLNDGFFTQALPSDFYACHSQQVQLTGVNFDAAPIGIRVYDSTLGPVAGRHGTATPAPLPVDTDLRMPTIAATMIDGFTRLEPRVVNWDTNSDGLVPTEFRVTNDDGQCSVIRANYQYVGRQINRSNVGTTINSNVDVTIDPTSTTGGLNGPPPTPDDFGASTNDALFGANLAVAMENDGTDQSVSNSFSGTELFVDRSLDGGVTWARTVIDDGLDQFAADAIRSFPMVRYDNYGNLWLSYLVDDFNGTTASHVILAVSFTQGATFVIPAGGAGTNGAIYSTDAAEAGLIDRPTIGTGPEGAPDQGVLIAFVDASTAAVPDQVLISVGTSTSFGSATIAPGTVRADTVAPGPNVFFRVHAVAAIGPNNEWWVSWVEPDFTNFPPVSDIRINVNADGNLLGAFFGTDQIVANDIEFPLGPPPSQPDAGRVIPLQSMEVLKAGPHSGRVVVAYEGTTISSVLVNPTFLHVFTTYSDDFAQTWNPEVVHQTDTADQFLPRLAADPITGAVYVTYYDSRNSAPINNTVQRFSAASAQGTGWGAPILISDGASAQAAGDEENIEYGMWAGLAVWNGCVFAGWADTADNGGESDAVVRLYQQAAPGTP